MTQKPATATEPAPERYEPPANLYQRLLAIMADLPHIQKSGKADSSVGGYAFVKHDDVTAALQPLLVKHGVFMLPSTREREGSPFKIGETRNKSVIWRTVLDLELVLINADKPEEAARTSATGYGDDSGDKGPGKAYSYAVKTAIQKLLCLPAGDEADNEAHDRQEAQPRQRQQGGQKGGQKPQGRQQASRGQGEDSNAAQDPAERARKVFWAKAREGSIDKAVVKAYIQRNYSTDTTKEFTTEQMRELYKWAAALPKAKTALQTQVQQGGLDGQAIVSWAQSSYSVRILEELTLAEWEELVAFASSMADEQIPFGDEPEGAPDDD